MSENARTAFQRCLPFRGWAKILPKNVLKCPICREECTAIRQKGDWCPPCLDGVHRFARAMEAMGHICHDRDPLRRAARMQVYTERVEKLQPVFEEQEATACPSG